jgi:protein SCO1/2
MSNANALPTGDAGWMPAPQGRALRGLSVLVTMMVLLSIGATASRAGSPTKNRFDSPPSPVDEVRLDQRLDAQVPLDVTLIDELGNDVKLGELVDHRPTVLVPAYYRCPMLCTQVISSLVNTIAEMDLKPGNDFQVVVFSIDPREQPSLAAEKKLNYLRRFGRNDTQEGWHFLTAKQPTIDALTEALGYGYVYDPQSDQFAHPAAVAVLTPNGRIARYLLNLDYKPRDVRLSLVEASQGKIGTVIDQVLLRCFHYDPSTGKYGFAIMTAIRVGGTVTVLGLIGTVLFLRQRNKGRRAPEQAELE